MKDQRDILFCGFTFLMLLILCITRSDEAKSSPNNTTLNQNFPSLRILASSHSTATAMVVSYLSAAEKSGRRRPVEVLIGGLEARMYRCICSEDPPRDIWEIGRGIREWANLEGFQVTVDERCLKSTKPDETAGWEDIRNELAAKRPVLISFSFDSDSTANLQAAILSRKRFTAVITGIREEKKTQILLLRLPLSWESRPEALEVGKLLGIQPSTGTPSVTSAPLTWSPSCPNIVFTFIRELKRKEAK